MKAIFFLGTCSTCQRILNDWAPIPTNMLLQEIKSTPMTAYQVDAMKELAGSYEALFSRRAMKFRSMGLGDHTLTEKDYRKLIIEEYTFLKRPVLVFENEIFIGSAKKTIVAANARLHV
jgi:arsenate reductase (glutaredoxin)